ncbi:MAG: SpoIIE family protein phosphatase [Phycisphaerae bacterium]|nr:SpoIIE family protein phosphatase [Phycisphaerae bacterium]
MALLINATVVVVFGAAEAIDFTRERASLLSQQLEKLKEEANVLAVARRRLDRRDEYQRFLDDFCRQMSAVASPGHHILALDPDGSVFLRAHARGNPKLEAQMIAAVRTAAPATELIHQGAVYLVASAKTDQGRPIVVAQSLEPMLRLIQSRAIARLAGVGVLALLIFLVTGVGLWFWVRRPLRQLVHVVDQVGQGRFQARAPAMGSAEVRFLAGGINAMASSLGMVERERRAEMERARMIQQRLLPSRETRFQGLSVFSAFVPTTSVAGDLFDLVEFADGSVMLFVIDVAGHGVPAALYTALLRTVLRYEMNGTTEPHEVLSKTNRQLHAVSDGCDFATCFVARFEPRQDRIQYAKAGHEPAILLHPDGAVDLLETSGLPLGVSLGADYRSGTVPIRTGDRLILYTDGLHEIFDPRGVPFGRERLIKLAAETRRCPAGEQVNGMIDAARAFQGSQAFSDDVTLVCVERD